MSGKGVCCWFGPRTGELRSTTAWLSFGEVDETESVMVEGLAMANENL